MVESDLDWDSVEGTPVLRPRFCCMCGERLLTEQEGVRYNRYTGEGIVLRLLLTCSKYKYDNTADQREAANGHDKIYWPPRKPDLQVWLDAQKGAFARE